MAAEPPRGFLSFSRCREEVWGRFWDCCWSASGRGGYVVLLFVVVEVVGLNLLSRYAAVLGIGGWRRVVR
jgi:hypothetical protein